MVCDMNALPDEVLLHIFSFLDARDALRASSVCRHWLNIVDCCSELLNGVCVSVEASSESRAFDVFSIMRRRLCYFQFKNFEIDCRWFRFLTEYSSQFQHLSFENCSLKKRGPWKPLNCVNLKILENTNCECWALFSYLPNLKSLHIIQAGGFSDLLFGELQSIVPSGLQEFSLRARLISDAMVYRRFYPVGTIMQNNPTDAILSSPVIEDFIKKRSNTIVSLDLCDSDISDRAAMLISEIDNLQLKRISLAACMRCCRLLPSFWSNQRSLVSIDLSGVLSLTDGNVVQMCTYLPDLKDVKLSQCIAINESVVNLFRLKRLKTLILTSCRGILRSSFQKAILGFESRNLRHLSLGSTNIDEGAIAQLLPLVVNLRKLNLGRCPVSNEIVGMISKTMKSLKYLNLSYCQGISDAGLTGRLSTRRRSLDPVPLSNIEGLLELNMSHCSQLSAESLTEAIRFPNLQSLDLTGCVPMSSAIKARLVNQNPRLTRCKI